MKQWQHISLKYLRYEHLVVVLRCLPSEEAVGLANLKNWSRKLIKKANFHVLMGAHLNSII